MSFEEKETRVFAIALALALTLTLFLYPEGDLNPHRLFSPKDFKSFVSTIPPSGLILSIRQNKSFVSDPGHPCRLAASLKTPTGCFFYARPYHPGEKRLNGSMAQRHNGVKP